MIIDDILTHFESVIEGENDAKTAAALKVRESRDLPEDPGGAFQGSVYLDATLPVQLQAFGNPGEAELDMTVEVTIGWEARGRHVTELGKALHTEARVRHALETDGGWPAKCNRPTWLGGEIQKPFPESPDLWAIVGRYRVVFLDTFPETA